MSTELDVQPAPTNHDDDDSYLHTCCPLTNGRWALCGRNVATEPWVDDCDVTDEECPACDEFYETDFCAHCAMGV